MRKKPIKGSKGKNRDLSGDRFGRLIVKNFAYSARWERFWYCECDCGQFTTVSTEVLMAGKKRSCGCLQREHRARGVVVHGMSKTDTYRSFRSMRQRCTNPKHRQFKDYGGRGIRVCSSWDKFTGFPDFLKTVGVRPCRAMTLDRIDTNGHYSCGKCAECKCNGWPMNVRWSEWREQQRNRRSNRIIVWRGMRKSLAGWAEYFGISANLLQWRLSKGWPFYKAATYPVAKQERIKVTINGVAHSIAEWCRILGLIYHQVLVRIRRGEPPIKALRKTNPIKKLMVDYKDKSWHLPDLCRHLEVKYSTVHRCLQVGWPLEDALTGRRKRGKPRK